MSRKYFFLVVSALLTAASHVYAEEEKRTPVEEFRYITKWSLTLCQDKAKSSFHKVEMAEFAGRPFTYQEADSEINACLKEVRVEVKKLFPKANTQIANKPAASKLLKEYYVVWLTALDDIPLGAGELMTTYYKRQNDASHRATDAWYRFEIEANF